MRSQRTAQAKESQASREVAQWPGFAAAAQAEGTGLAGRGRGPRRAHRDDFAPAAPDDDDLAKWLPQIQEQVLVEMSI